MKAVGQGDGKTKRRAKLALMWLYDIGKNSPESYKIIAELYTEEAKKEFTILN